jgi:hypothetical protein
MATVPHQPHQLPDTATIRRTWDDIQVFTKHGLVNVTVVELRDGSALYYVPSHTHPDITYQVHLLYGRSTGRCQCPANATGRQCRHVAASYVAWKAVCQRKWLEGLERQRLDPDRRELERQLEAREREEWYV